MTESIAQAAVDIRSLRALVVIADRGSFHAAARDLGYTQPAISHQIGALERVLGAELFTRPGGRGTIALTPAGEAVYRHAIRILGEVQALMADVQTALNSHYQELRIGTFPAVTGQLLPDVLRIVRERHPDVDVVMQETVVTGSSEDRPSDAVTYEQLASGEVDLAFLTNPEPDARISALPLMDDPWVVLTRRDSELALAEHPTLDLLDGADIAAWTAGWTCVSELEQALRRRSISPHVVYRTDDNLAMKRLVAAGYCHAVMGRLSAIGLEDDEVTWVEPAEVLHPRTITLCRPRHRECGPAVLTFIEAILSRPGSVTAATPVLETEFEKLP
jgi:molybdate transport repressor ModE-like protein